MTVFLIILAVLVFLNILPIGARVIYDENGVTVRAVLGLIQFKVLPGKPKPPKSEEEMAEEKRKKQEAKAAKKAEKQKKKELKRLKTREKPPKPGEEKSLGAKLEEFLPFIKLGIRALGDLRTLFTVRKLTLRITYGGEDAGKVAMNYGLAWSVCGAGMAILTKAFRIRRYDVEPGLDYDCKEMRIRADACVTITLGRTMIYLITYGIRALKIFRANKKKEKAVQQHESSST